MGTDALTMGRVTYERYADGWLTQAHHEYCVADKLNQQPKHVVSSMLDTADWENTIHSTWRRP